MDYLYGMIDLKKFRTLVELMQYFNNEQVCRNYLHTIRWGNGDVVCPFKDCQHTKCNVYTDGRRYKCAKCERQFSVRVGTIFEDSKISLQKWYAAIYLITSHKKGISSLQLSRDLGITQKSSWYLLHRVRTSLGLDPNPTKLSGVVEADETFIGGKEANKHKSKRKEGTQGRNTKTKTPVAGVLQRGTGKVIAQVVPNTGGTVLRRFVYENVAPKSELKTDEWYGYKGLDKLYQHSICNHSTSDYVTGGNTHTNTLEGYWSLVKRGCIGIYHSWSDKHLQKYLDEFSFRYFTRKMSENDRFNAMLSNIGTQLSYKQLISNETTGSKIILDGFTGNRQMEVKQGAFKF